MRRFAARADERDREIVDPAAQFDRDHGLRQVGGELDLPKRARRLARQCLVHADPIVRARRPAASGRSPGGRPSTRRCTARRAARASARRRSGRPRLRRRGGRTLPMNPDTADPRPPRPRESSSAPDVEDDRAERERRRAMSPMRAMSGYDRRARSDGGRYPDSAPGLRGLTLRAPVGRWTGVAVSRASDVDRAGSSSPRIVARCPRNGRTGALCDRAGRRRFRPPASSPDVAALYSGTAAPVTIPVIRRLNARQRVHARDPRTGAAARDGRPRAPRPVRQGRPGRRAPRVRRALVVRSTGSARPRRPRHVGRRWTAAFGVGPIARVSPTRLVGPGMMPRRWP